MRVFLVSLLALVAAQDVSSPNDAPGASTPATVATDTESLPTATETESLPTTDTQLPPTLIATSTIINGTATASTGITSAPTAITTVINGTVTDISTTPEPTDPIFTIQAPPLPQLATYSYPQPDVPDVTYSAPPSLFTAALGGLTVPTPRERFYNLDIAYAAGKPDGFLRRMSVINNQFPGPVIEGYVGDTLAVNVTNHLNTPQSIHWHGIIQNHTGYMDGVPGVSQCAIQPGKSFLYTFKLETSGTFWYHSHYDNSMADGIIGSLIVHGPDDPFKKGRGRQFDYEDERVLFLGDMYHDQSAVIIEHLLKWGVGYRGWNIPAMPDSILINGVGQTDCNKVLLGRECDSDMAPAEIRARLQSKVRFRLINPSAHAQIRVSIDQHVLKVVEVDDMPIQPIFLHELQIDPGQRYSVIVNMNQAGTQSAFWIRARLAAQCVFTGREMDGLAVLRYTDIRNTTWVDTAPITAPWPDLKDPLRSPCNDLQNDFSLVPFKAEAPPQRAYTVERLDSVAGTFLNHERELFTGFGWNTHQENGTKFSTFINYINAPLLGIAENGGQINKSRVATLHLDQLGAADIIINQLDVGISHPFHFHGRPFYILARGSGVLRAQDVPNQKLNLVNPIRRDTLTIPSRSWVILRLITDTPGVWPVHCHIGLHLAMGKMGVMVIRPDDIKVHEVPKPEEWAKLCDGLDPDEIGPARRDLTRRALPPQARAPAPVRTRSPMHVRQDNVDPNNDPNTPYFSMGRTTYVQIQSGMTATGFYSETVPPASSATPVPPAQVAAYRTLTGNARAVFSNNGLIAETITVVMKGGSPLQSAQSQGVNVQVANADGPDATATGTDGAPTGTDGAPTVTGTDDAPAVSGTPSPAPGSGSGSGTVPVETAAPTSV